MLELPEAVTIADQLNQTVKGKKITHVETEHTKHKFAWYEKNPKDYEAKVKGCEFGEAHGVGGMIELEAGTYRFLFSDGVILRYYSSDAALPKRYQARILLEDESSLVCSIQMYGGIFLIKPEEVVNPYYLAAKKKPMPGSDAFDYFYFSELLEEVSGSDSIKAVLATQQRIPGLGNGVLQDILLRAGIHPKKKRSTMRETDWKILYESICQVLKEMTEQGGRDTEKDLFGIAGRYRTKLSKKTYGLACPYCGTSIEKMSYLGGTIYFCPHCQKK